MIIPCGSLNPELSHESALYEDVTYRWHVVNTLARGWLLMVETRSHNIYKEPTWCNLAVCLLATAIILYMFRTLFASILYAIWLSAVAIDLGRHYWILHPVSCHTPEAVTTVFKCFWGWTQKASETCRKLQLLINILPSCITLVLYVY